MQNEDQKVPDLNQEESETSFGNISAKQDQVADQNVAEKMARGGAIPKTKQQVKHAVSRKAIKQIHKRNLFNYFVLDSQQCKTETSCKTRKESKKNGRTTPRA